MSTERFHVVVRTDSMSAEHLWRDDLPAAVVGGRSGRYHDGHRHHPAVCCRHRHHNALTVGHLYEWRGSRRCVRRRYQILICMLFVIGAALHGQQLSCMM